MLAQEQQAELVRLLAPIIDQIIKVAPEICNIIVANAKEEKRVQ